MAKSIRVFLVDQSGATAIEYALITSLIAEFFIVLFRPWAPRCRASSPKSVARSSSASKTRIVPSEP